jgi:hypothetical protein
MAAFVASGSLAAATVSAEDMSEATGFGTAPVPVKAFAGAGRATAAGIAHNNALANTQVILPLMAQPVGMMASAPVIDPVYAASILAEAPGAGVAANTVMASAVAAPATAATPDTKATLYLKLMELNGTTGNVRMILKNAKDSIRMVVIERAGTLSLTPQQELIYDQVARDILKQTETTLITDIARTQSEAFSEDEITALIRANDSPAARKYNTAKYVAPNEAVSQIQAYMVDAVYKILKTYKQASAS